MRLAAASRTLSGSGTWSCRSRAARDYRLNSRRILTRSPSPFSPRAAFGTGRSVRPDFSRQTEVRHRCPSTVAMTDVRPHACCAGGAWRSGTVANVQPPLPGTRKSLDVNSVVIEGTARGSSCARIGADALHVEQSLTGVGAAVGAPHELEVGAARSARGGGRHGRLRRGAVSPVQNVHPEAVGATRQFAA